MRQLLPIDALPAWARLNGISFHDVGIKQLQTDDGIDKGSAVVTTRTRPSGDEVAEPEILMVVPRDLVLSLDLVQSHAKSDRYLREVLDAVGEFGKTARGAILIFLLFLISHSHNTHREGMQDRKKPIGVSNPFSEYVKFIPASFTLPTFFSSYELETLQGTTLKSAVDAKMGSLQREFDLLRESTAEIPWCREYWWDDGTGFTLDDWKLVDAMYRSRALDLPGTGHAVVPCIDMANHASGNETGALYETDVDGNAVLQLRLGQQLQAGKEVTITYGDEKGAAEMIFSYGFLEQQVNDARQLFLDLQIPDDDPLKPAKMSVCDDAPGVRLFTIPGETKVDWESQFIWWACVNEEDGLTFRVLQTNDGERELKVFWKEKETPSSEQLLNALREDPMWEIFQMRATVMIQERVESQLSLLQASQTYLQGREGDLVDGENIRKSVWDMVMRLRELEFDFLVRSAQEMESKKIDFLESPALKEYLGIPPRSNGDDDGESSGV